MRLKFIRCFIYLFIFGSLNLSAQNNQFIPPPSYRVKQNIDFNWKFIRGDFSSEEETHQVNQLPWGKVNLPHDWSIEGPYDESQNPTQGFMPMGIGWYRYGLRLPQSWEDKKVFIIFDGIYRSSDVWMNYAYLGHHESGYTSSIYDLTDYVRYGNRTPNGIRVRVDGRRHEQDMYEGNGIYRHVWLLVTDRLHVDYCGTFVSTPSVTNSNATVDVKTKIKNENGELKKCTLITKLIDAEGKVVSEIKSTQSILANSEYEFVQSADVSKPNLWSVDNPYQYKAYSIVMDGDNIVDTYETKFGIRTFHFDSDKGFFLNNESLKLKGFCAHYDFAGIGTAIPDRVNSNLMKAMKHAGFNFYRSSHNPATPKRLDICDELGMMVWDEIERKLESPEIEHKLVEETITRDRNHPSIILWSLENESPLESTVFGAKIMKSATELAHKLDPYRFTTAAASMPINQKNYGENLDVVSYNYHWERADRDHIDFPHWKVGLISEYAAARARRGVYGIEHIEENVNGSHYDLNNGEIQTMYQMCERIEDFWGRIESRDFIGGGCLWSGVDAWGEGNAWPFISRGDGSLDLCFSPKDSYFYFRSQWIETPMVHVFPHWNWKGKEGTNINVWAYSNCDYVELFLNNRSLGIKKRPAKQAPFVPTDLNEEKQIITPKHFSWEVPYEPGILRIEGKINGKTVCSKEVKTSEGPYKIELSYMMEQFISKDEIPPVTADGRDIAIIKAKILDKDNNIVSAANNLINFSIKGEGQIIGVGNGNISSHEANKVNFRLAYNGLCVAVVQSNNNAGEIELTAKSEGLKSDNILIKTVTPKPNSIAVFAKRKTKTKANKTYIITTEVRDEFGVAIPAYNGKVNLKLSGPGEFSNNKNMIIASVKNGVADENVKINGLSGEIKIEASYKNLIPGKVNFIIKK